MKNLEAEHSKLKEFAEYIVNGQVFKDIDSDEADHTELGRYIWPDRYSLILEKAKKALGQN